VPSFDECSAVKHQGPSIKPASRFDSLLLGDRGGGKLKTQQRRLYLMGIGEIKSNYHRPMKGEPKSIM